MKSRRLAALLFLSSEVFGELVIDRFPQSLVAGEGGVSEFGYWEGSLADSVSASFSVTPYLQHPATNAMSVLWFAKDCLGEASSIKWWPLDGGASREAAVAGEWAAALTNNVASGGDSAVHGDQYKYRYRITGLRPGTAYGYAVELPGGVAYTNVFRTAPGADSPVRFIYYNDSETQPGSTGDFETWEATDAIVVTNTATGEARLVASRPGGATRYSIDQTAGYATNLVRMVERDPDLFVIAGDLVAQGGRQRNWDEFWRHNAGEYNDPAGSVPILAAIGNHDLQDATPRPAGCPSQCENASGGEVALGKFLSYFEVEPNGVDFSDVDSRDRSQMFHRVDYGPVTFLFLDTNNGDDYDVGKDTNIYLFRDANCASNKWNLPSARSPDFNPGSRQYDWLTNNLADAQANAKFTFVVNHHCPYSVGYHNRTNVTENGEWLSGRAVRALTDTMLRYGVDGWLCGHDEIMEHSRVPGTETLPDGTTRPAVLDVFDMGTAGDGLRGRQITAEANPYEVFRAQKDAPEIYDQNGVLVDGGKHYGHMEVNVREVEPGLWTATLEPVYVFVRRGADGRASGFERRVYDDVVVLTKDMRTGGSRSFPRTATPGQDGSAAHPFEIADEDDLRALAAAVSECDEARGLCYALVADVALAAPWPGIGIPNGKDLVTKNDPAFDVGAFRGVFDGRNHTVSGFQMVGVADNPANNGEGLDYCGFFNSICGATICNLKIQHAGSLFAVDTTDATNESGATFVGVAKNSLLQNLTSLAGTVSCSKDIGGIVGFLMAGTTVDSCTNNVNLTARNKVGGIAMITQLGEGSAVIRNCRNNGATEGLSGNQGGMVAFVSVATVIDGCEDAANAAPSFLSHHGAETMQGANRASAGVPAYTGAAIDGLAFATVDNGVASFVKNDDLALDGAYKVMGPNATAAFDFVSAGTISFDTSLATPTFDITAADGLSVSRATLGTVETFTAAESPQHTLQSGAPVPYAELRTTYAAFLEAADGDYEAAAMAPAANGRPVWECYVAGLDPARPESQFKVLLSFDAGGKPRVSWDPDLSSTREYVVEGADSPAGPYSPVTDVDDVTAPTRFYRVKVRLK